MEHVLKGSRSFTCTSRVHEPYLPLPMYLKNLVQSSPALNSENELQEKGCSLIMDLYSDFPTKSI